MLLAEKLADIANLAAGALIFGQFLSEYSFSLSLAAFGVGTWLVLTCTAVTMAKGIDP
jgi:type IV secretory pathway TrbD component